MKNPDRLRLFVWNFSPAQRTRTVLMPVRASPPPAQPLERPDHPVAEDPVDRPDQRLGPDPAPHGRERGPVGERPRRFDPVRERQPLRDRRHPARQDVELDVHAAEDEQQPEDDVVQRCRLAHEEADRRDHQPHPRAGRGRDQHDERDRQGRARRHRDPQDQPTDDEREGRGERGVDDHRHRPPDEERHALRGRDEHVAERLRITLALDRVTHREDARDRAVLERVPDHVELVGVRVRLSADVGEEQDLEDGRDEQARDVDPGREPAEERAEARHAADRRRRAALFT